MDSILRTFFSSENPESEVESYNRNFFLKYLNQEKVVDLIKVKSDYISLIRALKHRYDPFTVMAYDSKDKEVLQTQKEIDDLLSTLSILETRRGEISIEEKTLYDKDKYDSDRIEELENELTDLSSKISIMHLKLKRLMDKKDSISSQKKKNDELINKYDKELKKAYDSLVESFKKIDLQKLNLFDCFKSKKILSMYEEGLKEYIPNDLERRTYIEYFTKLINHETDLLVTVANVVDSYLKGANQNNGYYLPELNDRNKQIENYNFALHHLFYYVSLNLVGKDEKPNVSFINTHREVERFVDDILDYASDFEKYGKNPKLEKEKYIKIRNNYIYYYQKYEKSKPKILGVIRKKGYDSLEGTVYKDFVIDVFEQSINLVYENTRKEGKRDLNRTSNENPKFKTTTKKDVLVPEDGYVTVDIREEDLKL